MSLTNILLTDGAAGDITFIPTHKIDLHAWSFKDSSFTGAVDLCPTFALHFRRGSSSLTDRSTGILSHPYVNSLGETKYASGKWIENFPQDCPDEIKTLIRQQLAESLGDDQTMIVNVTDNAIEP